MSADSASPILSQEFLSDPYPVLARLREEDPVHFIPGINVWMITRYDDVRRLFTDPNVTNDPRAFEHYQAPPEGTYLRWLTENSLFSAPPEQHARQRKLVSAALTPRAVKRMEEQVRQVVEQFSEDIHKYLKGMSILARKDTLSYRTTKFLRRNWLPAATFTPGAGV